MRVSQYTPNPFPLGDGRRLITPFWADVDTTNGGRVSYRESTDTLLLQRATGDVRRAFIAQHKFTATWIFIATWERVAFYGATKSTQQLKVRLEEHDISTRLTTVTFIAASLNTN